MRTLRDIPAAERTLRVVAGSDDNPRLEAPCCGLPRLADGLLDLSTVPAAVRGRWLATLKPGAEAICGPCLELLEARGIVVRADVYRAVGAPPALVAKMTAHHRLLEERRNGTAYGL